MLTPYIRPDLLDALLDMRAMPQHWKRPMRWGAILTPAEMKFVMEPTYCDQPQPFRPEPEPGTTEWYANPSMHWVP